MAMTKPYIGVLRARPGPSSEYYADRDYYCWRLLVGARKCGLTYSQSVELCCRVFVKRGEKRLSTATVQRIYRHFGGRKAVERTKSTSMIPPEPFEGVEREVLKHMSKLHGRLRRGST